MKKKISICSSNSLAYAYNSLFKQFKKTLQHFSIGEMLHSKQLQSVLIFMGFIDEEPSNEEVQLSKTLTNMLSQSHCKNSVKRINLFKFLTVLCGVQDKNQIKNSRFFDDQAFGLALEDDEFEDPLIIIQIGQFDEYGKWSCCEEEKKNIRDIFASLRSKRLSRSDVEAYKRGSRSKNKQFENVCAPFKPKICLKSQKLVQRKKKNQSLVLNCQRKQRVEDRLLQSRDLFRSKMEQKLNKSIEKQLNKCTFTPLINQEHSRKKSVSLTKIRKHSEEHASYLMEKGKVYKNRKEKLNSLQLQLNESMELEKCTFHPKTTKYNSSIDKQWVPVRNRQKQIERLRIGNMKREFTRTVKQRGYPVNVNWSKYLSESGTRADFDKENNYRSNSNKVSEISNAPFGQKQPILCIDLKIMNLQQTFNVCEGANIKQISEQIGQENNIHESLWWKVEDLVQKAVGQCCDVQVKNNCIYSF